MEIKVLGQPVYLYNGGKKPTAEAVAQQAVVVFIHGAQVDHSCGVQQSRWFAHHGFSVLAPDLPGHGRSGGAALPSVETLALSQQQSRPRRRRRCAPVAHGG